MSRFFFILMTIMIHFPFKPHFIKISLQTVAFMAVLSSCEDRIMSDNNNAAPYPTFEVEFESSWVKGTVVSRNTDSDISIKKIDDGGFGTQMYLISESETLNDKPDKSLRMSRGTTVTAETFPKTFGLSAICYNSTTEAADLSDFTANFACNTSVSATGDQWTASDKLSWPGSGRIRFMAYAPYATTDNGIVHTASGTHPAIDFTVNGDVASQTDLLTASTDLAGSGTPTVGLKFGHALAAITIRTGDAMLAGDITKATISGIHGSGRLTLSNGSWSVSDEPAASYSADIALRLYDTDDNKLNSSPGLNIAGGKDSEGKSDGLTFFMIPQELTSSAKLTLEFTDKLTNTKRTLTAKLGGKDKSWEAGKLYTYSVSSTGVVVTPIVEFAQNIADNTEFKFDSIVPFSGIIRNLKLTSYVRVIQEGAETKEVEAPIRILASTDEGKSWQEALWESDDITVADKKVLQPRVNTGSLILPAQPLFTELQAAKFPDRKFNTEMKDLSEQESANCYMIHRPGCYKFSTVYGNSMKNGTANKSAYTINRSAPNAEHGMKFYADHANNEITTPYIKRQAGPLKDAFVLWSDSPGLIDQVELDKNGDYISFRLSKHSIAQGNAVIALRNEEGDIVWSWHIWVTDYDWTSNRITTIGADKKTYIFPQSTLGYCDSHAAAAERKMKIKFEFDLSALKCGTISKEISRTQHGIIASLAGDNTYYQWGRKDPMVAGVYDKPDHLYYSNGMAGEFTMLNKRVFDYNTDFKFSRSERDNGMSLGEAIRYPHHFVLGTGDYRQHWHNPSGTTYLDSDGNMYNAWNSTSSFGGSAGSSNEKNSQPVTKTIYDPSPAGYHIAPANAFSGFVRPKPNSGDYANDWCYENNKIEWHSDSRCWTFHSNSDGTGDEVKLYATGMRDMNVLDIDKIPSELKGTTWAAYSMITYLCSSNLNSNKQTLIFYLDNRKSNDLSGGRSFGSCAGSNNSYGFTVWPIAD